MLASLSLVVCLYTITRCLEMACQAKGKTAAIMAVPVVLTMLVAGSFAFELVIAPVLDEAQTAEQQIRDPGSEETEPESGKPGYRTTNGRWIEWGSGSSLPPAK